MTKPNIVDEFFKDRVSVLEGQIENLKAEKRELEGAIQKQKKLWATEYRPVKPKPIQKARGAGKNYYLRVAFGDTHGCHINIPARDAFLGDLDLLGAGVEEGVAGGDLIDCAGTYSRFQKIHLREFAYTIQDDIAAANNTWDEVQKRTPNCKWEELEGNHEFRINFWAIEKMHNAIDAKMVIDLLGPRAVLHLDQRGIRYWSSHDCHMNLNHPGMIQLGKCKFLHGGYNGIHATHRHLMECKDNVLHFHNHRTVNSVIRTPDKEAVIGIGCGCLGALQPYYFHYNISLHNHGYVLQTVNRKSQEFLNTSIPIVEGKSMLHKFKDRLVMI